MENQVWQDVSGDPGSKIYPILRKPDIVCSNSYLIANEHQLVLIDPGGLPEHARIIAGELNRLLDEKERPIYVFITHSHLDHCLQMMQIIEVERGVPVSVIAHQACADALEGRDPRATVADLMGQELEEITVGTRLFAEEDAGPVSLAGGGSAGKPVVGEIPSGNRILMASQDIRLPSGTLLRCYHTPGHSPDSICLRTGNLLFVGDILFAASPGVAGLFGWDHQALIDSVEKLIHVINSGSVGVCCPGHGRVVSSAQATESLRSIQREAGKLAGIQVISPERARMMAGYASDLMTEIDRLFTIIAGRLLFVTHILDELEEVEEAERLRGSIDPVFIDQMLTEFGQFSRDFRDGNRREIHVALKAGQITAKLAQCFDRGGLAEIIDPSFIRRVDRLLRDYSITFRGFDPVPVLTETDGSRLVLALTSDIGKRRYDEEAILNAEDDAAYRAALVARIAHVNPLEALEILTDCPGPAVCRMDADRAGDFLRHLVELHAAAGVKKIILRTRVEDTRVVLEVSSPDLCVLPLDERGRRFLSRSAVLCGGTYSREGDGSLRISFPCQGSVI